MKTRHRLYSSNARNNIKETIYTVEFYKQPWYRHLWHKVYHIYDMRFPVKTADKIRLHKKTPLFISDWLSNWMMNQDLRCYHNDMKDNTVLGRVEIDKELYESMRNG